MPLNILQRLVPKRLRNKMASLKRAASSTLFPTALSTKQEPLEPDDFTESDTEPEDVESSSVETESMYTASPFRPSLYRRRYHTETLLEIPSSAGSLVTRRSSPPSTSFAVESLVHVDHFQEACPDHYHKMARAAALYAEHEPHAGNKPCRIKYTKPLAVRRLRCTRTRASRNWSRLFSRNAGESSSYEEVCDLTANHT